MRNFMDGLRASEVETGRPSGDPLTRIDSVSRTSSIGFIRRAADTGS
jgi:hypothetical protein